MAEKSQEANNHPCMRPCRWQSHQIMKPIPHFAGSLPLKDKKPKVLIILQVKPRRIPKFKQRRKAECAEFIVLRYLIVLPILCASRCMKHSWTSREQTELKWGKSYPSREQIWLQPQGAATQKSECLSSGKQVLPSSQKKSLDHSFTDG